MVDILHGAWDFNGFFDDLDLKAKGMGASAAHPEVYFSKRFLQLRDLPELKLVGWGLDVPSVYKDTERHPQYL